ncbi:MAG TPA: hypothetical protein DD429_12390 [Clostridiaceae bacterium]|nr:hypothetical protein [Clostridiaceae bacterium]
MKCKKLVSIMLILTLVMVSGSTAYADEMTDKQNQYDAVQNRLNGAKKQYDSLGDEVEAGEKEIRTTDSSIQGLNSEIENMNSKIEAEQDKINSATDKLNKAIEDYNEQDERMKKRICAIYKNGTSYGYLEVILDSTSFSDFMSRTDIMQRILDYDVDMLKEMKQKREAIDKEKAELEQSKAELLAQKNTIESKKNQLEQQKAERKTLVAKVSRQMNQLKSYMDQEEATAKKLQNEIKALQSNTGNYDGSKYAILKRSDYPKGTSPVITSGFGYRIDPITGEKGAYHSGIDIGTGRTTNIPVYAMASGKVILAKWYGGYGNAVVVDHGGGLSTLYAHNNKLLVKVGDTVSGGQKIALSGATGRVTGPHVHFGVMKNGEYINPSPYLLIGN